MLSFLFFFFPSPWGSSMKRLLCAFACCVNFTGILSAAQVEHLTPPRLAEKFVKEKVTCIRPGREGFFHIAVEKKRTQLIIHDYGHGGSGWTLVFGSVNRAIRLFEAALRQYTEFHGKPIRVLGAGAHGQLAAILLQKKGYKVRLTASSFADLTSHKGAGIFAPGPVELSAEERKVFEEVLVESYEVWKTVVAGTHSFLRKGGAAMPLYLGEGTDSGLQSLVLRGLIPAPEQVQVSFGNGKRHPFTKIHSIFMDTRMIMEQMEQTCHALGIPREEKQIQHFSDFSEFIVFDCAGVGGGALNQDSKVVPVQGHLLTLQDQPVEQLRYMVYAKIHTNKPVVDDFGHPVEDYVYFTPKGGGTVGGSYIKGEGRLTTNQAQFQRILERSQAFFGRAD